MEIRRGRLGRYAPVFLWIGVIFYLSSDGGSISETSRFIRPLLQFLFPSAPFETIELYHGYIRKGAHLIEYAVLASLAVRALAGSSNVKLRDLRYILPVALAATVATVDEVNQSFSASRTGSGWDVLLDVTGSVIMSALLWSLRWPTVDNGGSGSA